MDFCAGLLDLRRRSYTHTHTVRGAGLAGLKMPSMLVQAQSSDGDDKAVAPVGEALELIIDAPSGAATASQQSRPALSSCCCQLCCFVLPWLIWSEGIIADHVKTLSQGKAKQIGAKQMSPVAARKWAKDLLKRQEEQWTFWQDWDGGLVKEQQMHQCCALSFVHCGTSGLVLGVWHRCC